MSSKKISIIILSTILFGNSLNCLSATQRRTVQKGRVIGHLVTPNVTITTNNPGEIPILPPAEDEIPTDSNTEPEEPVVVDNNKYAQNARIKEIKNKYKKFLNDAQLNCMDISDKLKVIQGLATGTTVISTVGTLATGGALASEIVKKDEDNKRNGLETGLLVGGALTSTGGVVTSAVALADMDKLINKMKDCRDNINNIKMVRSELVEEDVEDTDDTLKAINDIVSNCGGIDNSSVKNVESIKKILVGSTVTSSIGAATSVAAAVTNVKAKDETDNDKKDKLNLATTISTGISTGAQGVTLILGATTISKVNKDKDTADDCEKTLMKY